ncbi:hypothetical protein ADUPG1_004918 [Aduncisulcus paluster]|uniref:Uncharacterized protein n=1 Tax=Aduncisulcus paluster TaxID=2918883 RepID=A0ABQ5K732_9EUKA|nr:hypothetical protein ADUPG1_004918 [Aduncisulcus paluster]
METLDISGIAHPNYEERDDLLAQMTKEQEIMKQNFSVLKTQFLAIRQKNIELTSDLEAAKLANAELERLFAQERKSLQSQLQSRSEEIEKLIDKLSTSTDIEKAKADAVAEVKVENAQILHQLETQLESYRTRNFELEANLKRIEGESSTKIAELGRSLEDSLSSHSQEKDLLKGKFSALEEKYKELLKFKQKEHGELTAKIQELEALDAEKEEQRREWRLRVSKISDERDDLFRRVSVLQRDSVSTKEELERRVSSLQRESQEMRHQLQEQLRSTQRAEDRAMAAERTLTLLERKETEIKYELEQRASQRGKLEDMVDKLKISLQEVEGEKRKCERNIEELEHKLKISLEGVGEEKRKCDRICDELKHKLDLATERFRDEKKEIEAKSIEKGEQIEILSKRLKDKLAYIEQIEKEWDRQRLELKGKITEVTSDCKVFAKKISRIIYRLENQLVEDILIICSILSKYLHKSSIITIKKDDPTKDSLFSLLLPHILPWMKKYPDKKFFFLWINILKNITIDNHNSKPHKDRSSQLWFVFHPVLDVIKDTASKGITFDDDAVIRCLLFFANLSCIPSQAVEVHDCIKDGLLDGWFEMIKKKSEEGKDDGNWGTKYWSRRFSMFSTVPSLVPHISPKYDTNMEWCKKNGGWSEDYTRYLSNCYPSLKKWSELVETLNKSPVSESTSKLYHRDDILSVFLAFQSKSEIEEHKREIVLCVQCLQLFVRHDISGNAICLPIPDLNDLIDTFIGHLSRCEEVLEGDVAGEYCKICKYYSSKLANKVSKAFTANVFIVFQRILKRGRKEKRSLGNIPLDISLSLRYMAGSQSLIVKRSFLMLINKFSEYLSLYPECCGYLMVVLGCVLDNPQDKIPNEALCSEAWPLFHPVLDVVKREFFGDKIDVDFHFSFLRFFRNLCFIPSQAIEVFERVKDLLDGWLEVIQTNCNLWGHKYFAELISMISYTIEVFERVKDLLDGWLEVIQTNCNLWGHKYFAELISMISYSSSLIRHISPKYDMSPWMMEASTFYDFRIDDDLYIYFLNIARCIYQDYSLGIFYSIPVLFLLPYLETTPKDCYFCHICFGMGFILNIQCCSREKIEYFNVLTGDQMNFEDVKGGNLSCEMNSLQFQGELGDIKEKEEANESARHLAIADEDHRLCTGAPQRITYSSLIQYTPPQHMLVRMPFDEERSLRQSVYDLIERTGGGVEMLFDPKTYPFEGYDEYAWRERMEEEGEEEEDSFSEVHGLFC